MNKPVLVCLLVIVVSCQEITFREPQPRGKKALSEFPKQIWGKYLPLAENGELSKDTIIIFKDGYRFGYYEASDRANANDEEYESGVLSDSLVLKKFKGYYFVNFHEKPEWTLRVVKQDANGNLVYMAPEQEGVDFKEYMKKISMEIPVDSLEVNGKMLYQIDPAPKQLVRLIETGFFSKALLKKVR